MKRLILLLLAALMCLSPLLSCGGADTTAPDTTAAETDPPETTYDYDRIPDVIEPHEDRLITADELGYQAVVASTEKYWVAGATVAANGDVTVTSYNPGTTVITVKNKYAEKVEITVTVALDYSLESVELEKFVMPENYVVATDYGMSTSLDDNATKLQAAIDAVYAKGGGTVYIPKGNYVSSLVQLKDNVTLRLEGVLEEYNTAYTATLANQINLGSKFAVIKSAGKGDMFINHTPHGFGREGADNIAVIGGVLDMIGKNRCFIWCCGDGILLENVIMKDCLGDHAIQITGSKNVTIRDCMFAGYKAGTNVGGGETIQIEQAHSGAIGGDWDHTNSKFYDYEYYYCENIRIENCYFGPSINYGSHATPIGHHGQAARCSATGVSIVGCTFDNPRVSAIRPYSWTDVEIANNTFISNTDNAMEKGRYMIDLIFKVGTVQLKDGTYLTVGEDRGGVQNYDIHDNSFTLGGGTGMKGVLRSATLGNVSYGAKGYNRILEADAYDAKKHYFTGYKLSTNLASNINFYDNDIKIEHVVSSYIYELWSVAGVRIENNTLDSQDVYDTGTLSKDGGDIYGALLRMCYSHDYWAKNFKIAAISGNKTKPIVMLGEEAEIHGYCTASNQTTLYTLSMVASEGGIIERWADDDGTLWVEPIADEGYVFDGYYVGEDRVGGERFEFDASCELQVRFVPAQ